MTNTLGWCLDGHHAGCPGTVRQLTCDCPCHNSPAPGVRFKIKLKEKS